MGFKKTWVRRKILRRKERKRDAVVTIQRDDVPCSSSTVGGVVGGHLDISKGNLCCSAEELTSPSKLFITPGKRSACEYSVGNISVDNLGIVTEINNTLVNDDKITPIGAHYSLCVGHEAKTPSHCLNSINLGDENHQIERHTVRRTDGSDVLSLVANNSEGRYNLGIVTPSNCRSVLEEQITPSSHVTVPSIVENTSISEVNSLSVVNEWNGDNMSSMNIINSYNFVKKFNRRKRKFKAASSSASDKVVRSVNNRIWSQRKDVVNSRRRERYQRSPLYVRNMLQTMASRYRLESNVRCRSKKLNKKYLVLQSSPYRCLANNRCHEKEKKTYHANTESKAKKQQSALRHYHSCSPYRRSLIQRTSERIKLKYALVKEFRDNVIARSSARVSCLIGSSSKRRKLYDTNRCRWKSNSSVTQVRRKIQYQQRDMQWKASRFEQVKRYQVQSSLYRGKRKRYEELRYKLRLQADIVRRNNLSLLFARKRRNLNRLGTKKPVGGMKKGTAQYGKMVTDQWKRYRINYILSSVVGPLNVKDKQEARSRTFGEKKLLVTHLFEQVLVWQRQQRSVFYMICKKINQIYCDGENLISGLDRNSASKLLAVYYGGLRYHVAGHELYHHKSESFTYVPLSTLNVDVPEGCDEVSTHYSDVKARLCDDVCYSQVSAEWALVFHDRMKLLDSSSLIQELLNNVYYFQACNVCDTRHNLCDVIEHCTDGFRFINALKVHFVKLRTLSNTLFSLYRVAYELHLMEILLKFGVYEHYVEFKQARFPDKVAELPESNDGEVQSEVTDFCSDQGVIGQHGALCALFKASVYNDMPLHECCSCLKLVGRTKINSYEEGHKFLNEFAVCIMVGDYERHFKRKPNKPIRVCYACITVLKQGRSSCYGAANDMWPVPVPPQLSRLNVYEQQLVSLAKSYMRIVKLKPYRFKNLPSSCLNKAVKGMSIHLPLPAATVEKTCDILNRQVTLPDISKFLIEVDGLPNISERLLFRSFVDMSSVMESLYWLKLENVLYANVFIDDSFLLLEDQHLPCISQTQNMGSDDYALNAAIVDRGVTENVLENVVNDVVTNVNIDSVVSDVAKRPYAKKPISYFQSDTVGSVECYIGAACPDDEDGSEGNNADDYAVNAGHSDSAVGSAIIMAGQQMQDAVASVNFPIPYTVPYRSVLMEQLVDKGCMLMHLPDHEILEQYSIINMEPSLPKVPDLELFASKPVIGDPLSLNDPNVDVASFPILFPNGKNGLFWNRRTVSPAYYLQHRFEMSDSRFRRDQMYLFDCALRKDDMAISSSIYTMINCGKFGRVTAGDLKKGVLDVAASETLERNVNSLMGQVIGSVQYWLKVRRNLEAMIEEYGPATFFLTMSCAEYKNEDFKYFLEMRNWDVSNVASVGARNLATLDPVSVSVHFDNRFMTLWNKVIRDEKGPLGVVEHFYIKKEYQRRGSPHMHCLLWIKSAPVYGINSNEEVLAFINKHISCSLPDPLVSPILHKLVISCQTHHCTKSCLRVVSFNGKFFKTLCRYGFPREVSSKANMNTTVKVLESRVNGKRRIKLYDLARTKEEAMINDYNPALLFMWDANIDLQYVGEDSSSITYYVTGYVCKAEKQNIAEAASNVNSSLSVAGMLRSLACKLMKSRELGANEAADKVMRNPMYRMSADVVSPAFYVPSEVKRRLKPKSKIDMLKDDSEDVFCNNFQSTYYPGRPDVMEQLTAYDVLSRYSVVYGQTKKPNIFSMPALNARFAERKKRAVVKIWKPGNETVESYNRYCFQLVALFKPWRKPEELLKDLDGNEKSNYIEVYEAMYDRLPALQEFEASKRRLRKSIEWAENIKRNARANAELQAAQQANANLFANASIEATLDEELAHQSGAIREKLTQTDVDLTYSSLNDEQRKVYGMIIEGTKALCDQISSLGRADSVQRIFVSGVGGTGKSHLIRACRNYLELHYSKENAPAVLVAAPTGLAAMNIDGVTIHKLLKLPVQKSKKGVVDYWPLAPEDGKMLRFLFRNVKLLIIDEISMLSSMYLMFVHRRLNEILIDEDQQPFARFGNINILLLGDLLQLPPVEGSFIFQPVSCNQRSKSTKSFGLEMFLWSYFQFVELTQNMRQRDDIRYAELLGRVRIGSSTLDDLILLRSRLINVDWQQEMQWCDIVEESVNRFLTLLVGDSSILCLLATNELVDDFNSRVMNALKLDVFQIGAEDVLDDEHGAKLKKKRKTYTSKCDKGKSKKLKTADTGGLEELLSMAIGARVMLRRNLDPKNKLVNGSIGIVERVGKFAHTGKIEFLYVKFSGVDDVVKIPKVTVKYNIAMGLYTKRTQFPLSVAYAITIHKCQGLSLESAMVDAGRVVFNCGMAYVALSRIKSLNSLHLIRLQGAVLRCEAKCVAEYNRLRFESGISAVRELCNQNPELKLEKRKTIVVSADDQRQQLLEEADIHTKAKYGRFNEQVQGKKDVAKKTKAVGKTPVPIATNSVFKNSLRLSNDDGHSCFANAAVQCLIRCLEDVPEVWSCVRLSSNSIAAEFNSLLQVHISQIPCTASTGSLRDSFGNTQYSQQMATDCDTVEFMKDLLGNLPVAVRQQFTYVYEEVGTCANPLCEAMNVRQASEERLMAIGGHVERDSYKIKDMFPDKIQVPHYCIVCDERFQEFTFNVKYNFAPNNRYIVLNTPIADIGSDDPIDKILYGLRADNMYLFKQKWSVVSAVQMSSSWYDEVLKQTRRHYVAFVCKDNKDWVRLDDSRTTYMRRKPPFKHMVLYILKRLVTI